MEEEEEVLSEASPPLSHFSLYTAKFKGRRLGGGVMARAKGLRGGGV